jgi:hypothetical protein
MKNQVKWLAGIAATGTLLVVMLNLAKSIYSSDAPVSTELWDPPTQKNAPPDWSFPRPPFQPVLQAKLGAVEVQLVEVWIAPVPEIPTHRQLHCLLTITNVGAHKRITYHRFQQAARVSLQDEYHTKYGHAAPMETGPSVIGLEGGEVVKDFISFDELVSGTQQFTLTLPGESVGEQGEFILGFPRSMVHVFHIPRRPGLIAPSHSPGVAMGN